MSVLAPEQAREFEETIARGRALMESRVIWNVNSTARGGGVAEMLASLLAYTRGAGLDARWVVIEGDPAFFRVTKRIHNMLHGSPGDGQGLGPEDDTVFRENAARNARELGPLVRRGDVVLLHDPQTAGLIEPLRARGAHVVWRCHVGVDAPNALAQEAWAFLRPHVVAAEAVVTRRDGTPGRVDRRAELSGSPPLPAGAPAVIQVSRWDRLKDPVGVLEAFCTVIGPGTDAHLVLAGPSTAAVADDPEGLEVLGEVERRRADCDAALRQRVHLFSLPMDDVEENAAIVNALQRRADVIAQKSLAEGFGLTVSEAMWKARPVVASRVGGIQEQIRDGDTGVLVDPHDLTAFADAVSTQIDNPRQAAATGTRAREEVREQFLGPRHLRHYVDLFDELLKG